MMLMNVLEVCRKYVGLFMVFFLVMIGLNVAAGIFGYRYIASTNTFLMILSAMIILTAMKLLTSNRFRN
jgi:hypothetical protein